METKSETCILLSYIVVLINPNWYILSPTANKKFSHQLAFFYNVNLNQFTYSIKLVIF